MSLKATSPARQAGPLQAIMLLLPCTLSTMGIVVLVPVLPALMEQFKGVPNSEYWVPMILTTPALCLVVCSPLSGFLSDLIGRRRLLLASMVVYAIVGVLPLVLDGLVSILASRVAVGIVESVVLTVSTTLIGDFFKGPERYKWLAYQTAVASISATCLIFVGGLLGTFGWRGPFAVYASALILMVGVMFTTWEPEPDSSAGEHSGTVSWAGFPWRRMLGICIVTLFASILFYLTQVQLPLILQLHGVTSSAESGTLQAVASVGVPLGTITFRYLSMRMSVGFILFLAFLLMGCGFLAMGKAPDATLLLVAAGVNQLGAGITLPALLTWAMRGLPFELRGRGTGIWQGVFSVGQFFMPLVVTVISKWVGGLLEALVVVGVAALAAAAAAFIAFIKQGNALYPASEPSHS